MGWVEVHNAAGPRKVTPAQEEELRQRYLDGETATVLALEYGITVSRVRQLCPARTPGRKGRLASQGGARSK